MKGLVSIVHRLRLFCMPQQEQFDCKAKRVGSISLSCLFHSVQQFVVRT